MDFSTALKKLDDRINGLNVMRGRLVKFVNPQMPQTQPAVSAPEVAQTPATQVNNTSTPTQADTSTPTQAPAIDSAPEVELSDQERQDRLNLIDKLIRAKKIANEDLAPLGLHFEEIAPFNGKVWDNLELTTAFKDYLKGI
uniref:hypothetical protein n=1 Tax=Helicobacter suis TaxID=104628 RepID=UPI0013D22C8F